jgi:hypothetical protein
MRRQRHDSAQVARKSSSAVPRLCDLAAAGPGDATLHNFLHVLTAKLELAARLAVLEYEATAAGHETAARAFRRLAVSERRVCEDLLRSFRLHLDETIPAEEREETGPRVRIEEGWR